MYSIHCWPFLNLENIMFYSRVSVSNRIPRGLNPLSSRNTKPFVCVCVCIWTNEMNVNNAEWVGGLARWLSPPSEKVKTLIKFEAPLLPINHMTKSKVPSLMDIRYVWYCIQVHVMWSILPFIVQWWLCKMILLKYTLPVKTYVNPREGSQCQRIHL